MEHVHSSILSELKTDALKELLEHCRNRAQEEGHFQVISLVCETKPCNVLSLFKQFYSPDHLHAYFEEPSEKSAILAQGRVLGATIEGANRFEQAQKFSDNLMRHVHVVGKAEPELCGVRFYTAFTFGDQYEQSSSFFPATIFLPDWQWVQKGDKAAVTFNVIINEQTSLGDANEKIEASWQRLSSNNANVAQGSTRLPFLEFKEVGSEVQYLEAVRSAIREINKNAYDKIVLARALESERPITFSLFEALERLGYNNPDSTVFAFTNTRAHTFIGASPEPLFKIKDNQLETVALSASAKKMPTKKEDEAQIEKLRRDAKSLEEHQIVVDDIARKLKAKTTKVEAEEEPKVISLKTVHHLSTAIRADLSETKPHPVSLVGALHPTPAVGGHPHAKVLERIRALEPFSRSLYAGVIGWFDRHNQSHMLVGLRSALITPQKIRIYAGGGIMGESDPQHEKEETEWKFQTMRDALC